MDEPRADHDEYDEVAEIKKKRKRDRERAVAKVKMGKKLKASAKDKKKGKNEAGQDDVSDQDYDISMDMYSKKIPLPGQLDNCDECGVRFTVTPYSRTGPEGGLLCRKCSKKQDDERKHESKLKKQGRPREKRRQTQSSLLDGIVQIGARNLLDQCLKVDALAIQTLKVC